MQWATFLLYFNFQFRIFAQNRIRIQPFSIARSKPTDTANLAYNNLNSFSLQKILSWISFTFLNEGPVGNKVNNGWEAMVQIMACYRSDEESPTKPLMLDDMLKTFSMTNPEFVISQDWWPENVVITWGKKIILVEYTATLQCQATIPCAVKDVNVLCRICQQIS